MKCPICRSENVAGTEKCTRCGTVLIAKMVEEKPAEATGPVDYQRPQFGAPPALGPSRANPEFGYSTGVDTVQKTTTSLAGGILVLAGGILSCLLGVVNLLFANAFAQVGLPLNLSALVGYCGVVEIIFGSVAVIGGVFGVMRKKYSLAMVGAVFCILSVGYVYISVILGILGLLMLMLARHDFE